MPDLHVVSLAADQKALLFLGTIAVLGATVRIVRAAAGSRDAPAQPALERQIQAADSAREAKGRHKPNTQASVPVEKAPVISRDHPLDIDTANASQLDLLPGIGPSLARRIVAERANHGPFVSRERFDAVKGVGPALLARLDSLITFSGTIRPVSSSDESTFTRKSRRRRRP